MVIKKPTQTGIDNNPKHISELLKPVIKKIAKKRPRVSLLDGERTLKDGSTEILFRASRQGKRLLNYLKLNPAQKKKLSQGQKLKLDELEIRLSGQDAYSSFSALDESIVQANDKEHLRATIEAVLTTYSNHLLHKAL